MLYNPKKNPIQDLLNILPENTKTILLKKLSKKHNLSENLEEISSFYKTFSKEKINKPIIYVGAGTCGLASGADASLDTINEYIKNKNIDADIVKVGCIGLCSSEPLVDIQMPGKPRVSFKHATSDKINEIMDSFFSERITDEYFLGEFKSESLQSYNKTFIEDHPFFRLQQRTVLANCGIIDPINIDEYIAFGGYHAYLKAINNYTPKEICETVKESGLKGRGGGGFLTGMKWEMANREKSSMKYMICNADEGDPGAFMDRAVIEGDPHRLIEGLAIAAYAINAEKAYIYIRAEYPLAIERLKIAIEDAKQFGIIGNNIFDSGINLEIVIKEGAGAFVCGEETALMHSIEGKRGMPRPRPPYPAVSGLFEKPTIINNVETLANVPDIISKGKDWFNSIGTENSKGTKVFALSGKVNRTGLIEVAMGTSINQIVFDIGGGIANGKKYKAVQMGGPSGGCIPENFLDIKIDYESLKQVGAMMGSGGLVVMDEDNCMVDVAKFFMDFIQRESCGKCIPCREGTKKILDILNRITKGRKYEHNFDTLDRFQGIVQLENLAKTIKETSLCGLGQTAANPVLSTLRWFRHEYESHIFERKCETKSCLEMLTYSIDNEKCIGCTACARNCPTNAIVGQKKESHYIIEEKCINCGSCVDTCKFNAVNVL